MGTDLIVGLGVIAALVVLAIVGTVVVMARRSGGNGAVTDRDGADAAQEAGVWQAETGVPDGAASDARVVEERGGVRQYHRDPVTGRLTGSTRRTWTARPAGQQVQGEAAAPPAPAPQPPVAPADEGEEGAPPPPPAPPRVAVLPPNPQINEVQRPQPNVIVIGLANGEDDNVDMVHIYLVAADGTQITLEHEPANQLTIESDQIDAAQAYSVAVYYSNDDGNSESVQWPEPVPPPEGAPADDE